MWLGLEKLLSNRRAFCSLRVAGFDSKHPHSGSQPSATWAPYISVVSSNLWEYCPHVVHIHRSRQNTHMHKLSKSESKQNVSETKKTTFSKIKVTSISEKIMTKGNIFRVTVDCRFCVWVGIPIPPLVVILGYRRFSVDAVYPLFLGVSACVILVYLQEFFLHQFF